MSDTDPAPSDNSVQPSASEAQPSDAPAPKRRGLRRVLIAGQIVIGVGAGLFITEKVFTARDEGAFPHVNFYVEDPELGVRLRPGATMKFHLHTNPLSQIEINADGYRGADWPAASESTDEIIAIGDSQVFGLGVEGDETFAAQLASATGRTVLNAGVPTYGPPEYLALARELLAARKPKTLLVTINFLNDPFEINRPNKDRHAVWDGWAVRAEHAPTEVREFPGRAWLYSQSHAFYAFRRWRHERGESEGGVAEGIDFGTPSEGGFGDLIGDSTDAHAAREQVARAEQAKLDASRARLAVIEQQRFTARDKLDGILKEFSDYEFDRKAASAAGGRPGDIVEVDYGESGRSVELTAALIREAARERQRYIDKLLRKKRGTEAGEARELLETDKRLGAERDELRRKIAAGVPLIPPPESLFGAYLDELAAACAEHGTELVVVALPVDVQVDAAEWDKYGVEERPDMSESLILLSDFVAAAETRGVRAVDVTEALRAAEPGAFLDGDIHMTAKGHAAFAEAVAARLDAPMPVDRPQPGLPADVHFVPERATWRTAGEFGVAGSTKLGCRTMYEQGWLNVACARRRERDGFRHVEVVEGGTHTTMAVANRDGLALVTPLEPGQELRARFEFKRSVRELKISWTQGESGELQIGGEFLELDDEPRVFEQSPAIERWCDCRAQVEPDAWILDKEGYYGYDDGALDWEWEGSCGSMWLDQALNETCREAHGDSCSAALFSCVQHDPLFAPSCADGTVHAFASNACFAICDDAHPCASGSCAPWQGGGVCIES